MKLKVKMPRLGMNMESGLITSWIVPPGGVFAAGDPLYEVEMEKANTVIEADAPGRMIEHLVSEKEEVAVGTAICIVDIDLKMP